MKKNLTFKKFIKENKKRVNENVSDDFQRLSPKIQDFLEGRFEVSEITFPNKNVEIYLNENVILDKKDLEKLSKIKDFQYVTLGTTNQIVLNFKNRS